MGSDLLVARERFRGPKWVALEVASCVALARLNVGLVTWVGACTMTTISDDTAIGPVHVTTHMKKKNTHMHVRNEIVGIARVEGGCAPLGVAQALAALVGTARVAQEREAL